ncbi:Dyp-type peroxidase, partial [Vibrio vulnificus]
GGGGGGGGGGSQGYLKAPLLLGVGGHSLPYGSVTGSHGLLFIAYCHTLHNFKAMLESMYGVTDGKTDQLLRFTKAVTGAYFFAPSKEMLSALAVK